MLDLLEKGMREIDDNDWMTAYEIEGHPDLHLSHHYFRNLSPDQAHHVIGLMKDHFAKNPLQAKPLDFSKEEMFGKDKDIRVLANDDLVPHLDPELKNAFTSLHPSQYGYRPHVTTDIPTVHGKIKKFYFKRGNGVTYFSTDAKSPENATPPISEKIEKSGSTPTVNAKVENIEVKRPMSGAGLQQVGAKMAAVAGTSPKVPVPPKPSPTTGKMNNMPNKLTTLKKAMSSSVQKPNTEPATLDYSKFQRPQYSTSGSVPPIHKPLQHSKGATQGMTKTEENIASPCIERLRKLRKSLADKKPMPVHMRD